MTLQTVITMQRHIITISLLVLAVLCYGVGLVLPGLFLFIIGAVFELAFWYRLFARTGKDKH